MKRAKKITSCLLAAFVLCMGVFTSMYSPRAEAFAAESASEQFEAQNVTTDLKNSVIAGEKFNAADYPHNESIDPQMISFAEFGYSYSVENQQDFGLYVYIYNPQDVVFDTRAGQSAIEFSYGDAANDKYPLIFLNYSEEQGYEGRFYKFKVNLTSAQKKAVLDGVSQNARVYSITSFELAVNGRKTAYICAQTYTYSGYSLGYGSAHATESTLSCAVEGFEKYVELDVHQTVYRPEGDYYEGQQSQLNSCYFRVPEKFFTDYGDLTKVVMEWYEYLTKPILVTETNYLYQRLYELHGGPVKDFSPTNDFFVYGIGNVDTSWVGGKSLGLGWASDVEHFENDYSFWDGLTKFDVHNLTSSGVRFDNFAAVFYAGSNQSYKDRFVSASELEEQFLLNSEYLGEPYFGGLFSQALFTEYVNDGHTRGLNKKTVHKDDLVDTWWNITTKDGWWQTVFGGYDVDTIYDSMKAIVTSADKDFDVSGSDEDVAERLKIGEADVADFKAEYKKAQANDERLVLLRYGESTYYSIPCTESYCSSSVEEPDLELVKDCVDKWKDKAYTAYMAQETVYLDFDIISLWFKAEDGVETEIPVVMSPQNVFSGLNPPNEENYHNKAWKWVLALLALLLILVLLAPVLPYLVQLVIWIITAPFKLIAACIKGIKNSVNKHKKE